MDLKEFSSPLPKPWLNINANSVHVGPGGGGTSNPVSTTAYSQTGLTTISNTNAIRSLSSNAAATGSLTIGPLPVGAVVHMKAYTGLTYNHTVGGGLTFYVNVNGSQAITTSNTVQIQQDLNTTLVFEADITVLPSSLAQGSLTATIAGFGSTIGASSNFALPANQANVFDFAFAFQNASTLNTLSCIQYYVELLNAN